jgi:hypothetical protein
MLRKRPEIVLPLLRAAGYELPAGATVRTTSSEFTQVAAVEYRADSTLVIGEPKAVLGVVCEVQLRPDARKRSSWPNYVTGLYANLRCPCVLLVITPSRSTARWATRPIRVGPGMELRPSVIGPDGIPAVTDLDQARQIPELAVLSVLAHGKDDVKTAVSIALAATAAISSLDEETQALYSDLTEFALSRAARKAFLEMIPENYQFRGFTYKKGLREGRLEGKEEGRLEGKEEGRLEGKIETLLLLLRSKFGEVPRDVEARIHAAQESELLAWSERVLTAATLNDVFGG